MERIKLKIKQSRLPLIADALLQYADLCAVLGQTENFLRQEDYLIRMSIASEMYYKIKERMDKRYPPETYKLPCEMHEATVLQCALLRYVDTTEDDFKRNAIDIVKNDLNQMIVGISKVTTYERS